MLDVILPFMMVIATLRACAESVSFKFATAADRKRRRMVNSICPLPNAVAFIRLCVIEGEAFVTGGYPHPRAGLTSFARAV